MHWGSNNVYPLAGALVCRLKIKDQGIIWIKLYNYIGAIL